MKTTLTSLFIACLSFFSLAVTHQVDIQGFQFSPQNLTINLGDHVIWTNLDGASHTTTSTSAPVGGGWDSGIFSSGMTFEHVFDVPGDYSYHCYVHTSMTGTIKVIDPNAPVKHVIDISGFSFVPSSKTINAGDTVCWVNNDFASHTATSTNVPVGADAFDTGILGAGATSTEIVLTVPGEYDYFCYIHTAMTASITVVAPSNAVRHDIEIFQFSFSPQDISVNPGDTVVWTNVDNSSHGTEMTSLVVGTTDWMSPILSNGQTFSYIFNEEGVFDYECFIHKPMTGSVTVGAPLGTTDETKSELALYPNPVKDKAYLEGQVKGDFQIFDVHGNIILEGDGTELDLSKLVPGSYVLTVGQVSLRFSKLE